MVPADPIATDKQVLKSFVIKNNNGNESKPEKTRHRLFCANANANANANATFYRIKPILRRRKRNDDRVYRFQLIDSYYENASNIQKATEFITINTAL